MPSSRKRGQNEGSIFQRADGRWAAAVSLGNGRRKYVYGKTRAAVSAKMDDVRARHAKGLPLVPERQTVADLSSDWLESVKPTVRGSTWLRYEQLLRVNALPEIGSIKLAKLNAGHLERLYGRMVAGGASPQTAVHVHRVLHSMLAKAARWDLVSRNVAALADTPRLERREMNTLTPAEARQLYEAARGSRMEAFWRLAIGTGMRLGEMLALHWAEVDLDAQIVRVTGTLSRGPDGLHITEPKTKRSRRAINISKSVTAALSDHMVRQTVERLKIGPAWQDSELVFPSQVGTQIDPGAIGRREFKPLLKAIKVVRHIRVHDLRHTAITFALSAGIPATDVADMAGHSTVAVTLSRYGHALPDAPRRATDAIERVIFGSTAG